MHYYQCSPAKIIKIGVQCKIHLKLERCRCNCECCSGSGQGFDISKIQFFEYLYPDETNKFYKYEKLRPHNCDSDIIFYHRMFRKGTVDQPYKEGSFSLGTA